MADQRNKPKTICWFCDNAVPVNGKGCSWSRSFLPVEGWDAVPTIIQRSEGYKIYPPTGSYLVRKCPMFEMDSCTKKYLAEKERIQKKMESEKRSMQVVYTGGNRCQMMRVLAKMRQSDAAEKIGVDIATLRKYENGYSRPYNKYTFTKMAKVYGCKESDLGFDIPSQDELAERNVMLQ